MRNLTKISQTSSGTYLGLATTDKVALHGVAPCVQASAVTTVVTTAATSTTPFGFTEAQANGILAALAQIRVLLTAKGITA
jgi:hypothetical protein